MTEQLARNTGTTAIREPAVTNHHTTPVFVQLRRGVIAALLLAAACGGGGSKRSDTYARANDVQGQCCQHLAGAGRDTCLSQIVRVDDAAIAQSSANQATYAWVAKHFVCDPSTGHPTQQSAQTQLECIQDLQQ
jgi:hypothetical protein